MKNSTGFSKRSPDDFAKAPASLDAHLLKRIDQRILALERRRQFFMTDERKRDAREKFLLGGLVVKAGLQHADRAFLLGVLIEASRMHPGSAEHHRLQALGNTMFRAERANAGSDPE